MAQPEIEIRDAVIADLPRIFAIYNREVEHGIATFDVEPRRAGVDDGWLLGRASCHPVLVGDRAGEMVGWGAIGPWSPRGAYRRTGEVSVYVDEDARGAGVGSSLLGALINRARGSEVAVLLARVAQPNPASTKIHEAHGFKSFGIQRRCGEKLGQILDVELMDMHLDEVTKRPRSS
ncbi:MAG: N-acetyltransferase [Solirubrobacterales bacterium]|nr:N-acetyltransferase [Solirubrobacterales bacterium]